MKLATIIILCFSAFLISCNRTSEKSIQASKDYALVQADLTYVVPLVIHTVQSQTYLKDKLIRTEDSLNTDAIFEYVQGDTVDISNDPVKFNLTFAQDVDIDGKLKNGSLNCTVYEYFDVDQAECRVIFDAFSISNYIITGTLYLKRINGSTFEIEADKVQIIVGTKKITYNGLLSYNIGTGADGTIIWDNTVSISDQTGSLVDRYGSLYNIITAEPIYRDLDCRWLTEGIVEIRNVDDETQIIDFGAGACENDAIVTNAEEETVVQL